MIFYCYYISMAKNKNIIVSPSLLAADFSNIKGAVEIVEASGSGWLHLDIMDGEFVPNITFGPKVISDIRRITSLKLDTHLMIMKPERYIKQFADAGSDYITVHFEATYHVHRAVSMIKTFGKKAGVSIVPATSVGSIVDILPYIDLLLVMSVNPGFGGQKFIKETLKKVKILKDIRNKEGYNYKIEIDGGINRNNCKEVIDAGVDVIVAGTTIFHAEKPAEEIKYLMSCRQKNNI